ncbi:hypothetical protein TNCV_4366221 [Trichonephila clavipes]|nr:hypothetical protein TNCV_4366221 [Trichonephila clavipes]
MVRTEGGGALEIVSPVRRTGIPASLKYIKDQRGERLSLASLTSVCVISRVSFSRTFLFGYDVSVDCSTVSNRVRRCDIANIHPYIGHHDR